MKTRNITTSQLRNSIHASRQRCGLLLVSLLLTCFALPQRTQAVVPAPDGGYVGKNTAEGTSALFSLTTGVDNTALGFHALYHNTIGNFNTAEGFRALFNNTGGTQNTATGFNALVSNTTGVQNTANGVQALPRNTTGNFNTANGVFALYNNMIGIANTATGDSALSNNTTGSFNTALGVGAGSYVTTASGVICIGTTGYNENDSCFIGKIFGVISSGGTAVFINSDGKLGTVASSRRFKEEIKPMDKASEALLALKPVTFRYKKGIDPQGVPQFGLVAEDVEAVNPDLVVRDKEGKVNTVRYDAVNAMLLNEFLKEHKAFLEEQRKVQKQEATISQLKSTVAEQNATIAQQQKGMEAVTARLNEQAAQIQKVSAQLEASKPVPQVANNP